MVTYTQDKERNGKAVGYKDMTRERQIEILMMDRCTKPEAEKFLKRGTTIFEDLEENFDNYMDEWKSSCIDEEEYTQMVNNFKKMIETGEAVTDWSVVKLEGKNYYIMYVL